MMSREPATCLGESGALIDDDCLGRGRRERSKQQRQRRGRRLERRWRAHARAHRLDRAPTHPQAIGIGGKIRRRRTARGGAQDETFARAGDLAQRRDERLTLRRRYAFSRRDARASRRHVEKAADETQPHRHADGLVGARFLGHLDRDGFALVQRGDAAARRGILGAEEGGTLHADIDERRRQLGLERDDAAEYHLADAAAPRAGAEHAQLPQHIVRNHRGPQLARRRGDEQRAASRAGRNEPPRPLETVTGEEIDGLEERQADDVRIGADDLADEARGQSLDGIAAGLAPPFAGGEIIGDLARHRDA